MGCKVSAGKYRHRIEIQSPTRIVSESGATKEAYAELLKCWAEVKALAPREFWAAQQIQSEISTKIALRYRPGIHSKCRILHRRVPGSPDLVDVYDIEGPPVIDTHKREIVLNCVRRDAKGFRAGYDAPPTPPPAGAPLLNEDGTPLLNEDGQPILNEG